VIIILKFLDSSVFLYAYLKPSRKLKSVEKETKEKAKKIITRVEEGEEVVLTVVHLNEILSIIEARLGRQKCFGFLSHLLQLENIHIVGVEERDYEEALSISSRYDVSISDALAYVKMMYFDINEIYTFNENFKKLPNIKVIQE